MAASPFFSGRIPQSLFDAVEQHSQATKESKTTILKNALSAYLGLSPEPAAIDAGSSRLESLENRLTRVEQILSELQSRSVAPAEIEQIELNGQLSFESIQPVETEQIDQSDNSDNRSDDSENSVIFTPEDTDDSNQEADDHTEDSDNDIDNRLDDVLRSSDVINLENTDNTSPSEIWTSSQISERLGLARRTFEDWSKKGNLPRSVKGHTIVRLVEKRKIDGRLQNAWEVRKATTEEG